MNKYAAEKIATEYYQVGVELALNGAGMSKTASPAGKILRALGLARTPPPSSSRLLTALGLGGAGVAGGVAGGAGSMLGQRYLQATKVPSFADEYLFRQAQKEQLSDLVSKGTNLFNKGVLESQKAQLSDLVGKGTNLYNKGLKSVHADQVQQVANELAMKKQLSDLVGKGTNLYNKGLKSVHADQVQQMANEMAARDLVNMTKSVPDVLSGIGREAKSTISNLINQGRAQAGIEELQKAFY